jgi:hypothetical protein
VYSEYSMSQTVSTIISCIATLLAGALGFWVYWLQIRGARKEFSYDFAVTHISGFDNQFGGSLKLTFEGQPVANVSFIKLFIRNSGRTPIDKKDFDGWITINVLSPEILWSHVTGVSDNAIRSRLDVSKSGGQITMNPLTLNPGDEIELSVLAREFNDIGIIVRILGVKEIKRKSLPPKPFDRLASFILLLLVGIITFIAGVMLNRLNVTSISMLVAAVVFALYVADKVSHKSK